MKRLHYLVAAAAVLTFALPGKAKAQGNSQPGPWTGFGTSLVATGSDIWVRFFGADAGYTNILYSVCDLVSNCQQALFQNHDPNAVGQEVHLNATFTAGQEVIFKLFVQSTGDTWFSGSASRNADGFAHFATQAIHDVTANAEYSVLGGFEDLYGGGDQDRNDLMFEFGNVAAVTATPEPATLTLMGTGLLGLVGVAHRRRRKREV